MVCPNCHNEIAGGLLTCRNCLERAAWAEAERQADRHLADIAKGKMQVYIMRKFRNTGDRHIRLPNHYGTWCGVDTRDFACCGNKDKKTLNECRDMTGMCRTCLDRLEQRIRELVPA